MTPDFVSLDASSLESTAALAPDQPLSTTSEPMMYSQSQAIGGTMTSMLEPTLDSDTLVLTESMCDFQDEAAFFSEFELYSHTTSSQSFSDKDLTIESTIQPSIDPILLTPESHSNHASLDQCDYPSPLFWVANWLGPELSQLASLKTSNTSLPPETVESLLRDFFQFVNPTFPVVSEWDVYRLTHPEKIQLEERLPPMSLALFYAIMFAACAVRLLVHHCGK